MLLNFLVTEMEEEGFVISNYIFGLDQEFIEACNAFCGTDSLLDEYHDILHQCITHNYITHRTMSPLTCLAITQKGMAVVSSNRRTKEKSEARTCLKKISDLILDHQGLIAASGITIALVTLIIKILD